MAYKTATLRHFQYKTVLQTLFGLAVSTASISCAFFSAKAEGNPVTNCSDVEIDFQGNRDLTRNERIALMDQALFDSLSKFDACQASLSSAGEDKSATDFSGAGMGDVLQQQSGSRSSQASLGLSGTESPSKKLEKAVESPDETAFSLSTTGGSLKGNNGGIPEDIPPADNDDLFASQIRYAATQETDTEKKAKLWNEYRKYTGIPTQD